MFELMGTLPGPVRFSVDGRRRRYDALGHPLSPSGQGSGSQHRPDAGAAAVGPRLGEQLVGGRRAH